jgi:hypothetical protein
MRFDEGWIKRAELLMVVGAVIVLVVGWLISQFVV